MVMALLPAVLQLLSQHMHTPLSVWGHCEEAELPLTKASHQLFYSFGGGICQIYPHRVSVPALSIHFFPSFPRQGGPDTPHAPSFHMSLRILFHIHWGLLCLPWFTGCLLNCIIHMCFDQESPI